MSKADIAVETFSKGYNCAQAILSTYAAECGLNPNVALRLAGGFGGGIARQGDVCGAITGAIMVLGLKMGSSEVDPEIKARLYGAVLKLCNEFKTRHGSMICRDLLGCDIQTEEGMAEAREKGLLTTLCPVLVRDAVTLLEKVTESK